MRRKQRKVKKAGSCLESNPGQCLSRTPGSHSVCAVRTPLGIDQKIVSIRKEPMSGFLTPSSQHSGTTCAVHVHNCEGQWFVRLLWLSGRALAEHSPSNCRFIDQPLVRLYTRLRLVCCCFCAGSVSAKECDLAIVGTTILVLICN